MSYVHNPELSVLLTRMQLLNSPSSYAARHSQIAPTPVAEHYADDLEVLLDQAMDEDFSVQLEDGSAILVAKQLVRMAACVVCTAPAPVN